MMRKTNLTLAIVVLLGLLAPYAAAQTADPNLIAHWTFDEGTGTIAYDLVGGNDGILYGDPNWTSGQIGGALEFDGSGDLVDCGNDVSISELSTFSISLWFKTDVVPGSGAHPLLISQRELSDAAWSFILHGDFSGRLTGRIETSGTAAVGRSNFIPEVGQWYHAAMTYDDSGDRNVRVYVDGDEQSYMSQTTATGTILADPTIRVAIGNSLPSGKDWDGVIDDVRIYDTALSPLEIELLYWEGFGSRDRAIMAIDDALDDKLQIWETTTAAFEKEWAAHSALDDLLASGDYGDLDKRDIAAAQRQLASAIRRQQRLEKVLLESIQNLEDSLSALGYEPDPND